MFELVRDVQISAHVFGSRALLTSSTGEDPLSTHMPSGVCKGRGSFFVVRSVLVARHQRYFPSLLSMHKATRIIGMSAAAAAGAVGTYLYMKPKLRRDLRKTHSASEAMDLIGHELEHDALAVAGKAMDMGSDRLSRISKAFAPRSAVSHSTPRRHVTHKAQTHTSTRSSNK